MPISSTYPCIPQVRPDRPRARAFTLVELLVVIAIIGVLVAITLVSISGVNAAAKRALCAKNMAAVGQGVWLYAMDHRGRWPTHHTASALAFDTVAARTEDGQAYVNLGLILGYEGDPESLYCPTQTADRTPELSFGSSANPWQRARGRGRGNGDGDDDDDDDDDGPGNGNGPGNGGPPFDDFPGHGPPGGTPPGLLPAPGTNAAFAARAIEDGRGAPAWATRNYGNKVIYTDFLGVDGWRGGGRLQGPIYAPHDGNGYNRLFGDGSVHWVDADAVNTVRPVNAEEPSRQTMLEYYNHLDVLP